MQRIKHDDEIIVVAGKDKGRRGKVMKLTANDRVLVEGVNLAKKHEKADPNNNKAGGIIEKEMPIHISNVMLYNPITKKGDRIGIKTLEDGRKVRFFKSNNEVLDA